MIKNSYLKRGVKAIFCLGLGCFFFASPLLRAEETMQMPAQCDNAHFLQDRNMNMQNSKKFSVSRDVLDLPEHICGVVMKVLRAKKTKSGLHGYFLLSVGEGKAIKIVSNLEEMENTPQWPWVKEGDHVEVQGRYYYDSPKKQGIDWTHHGTSRKWAWPGFVMVGSQKYQ